MSRAGAAAGYPMNKHHFVLVVVGAYLWVMLILFGSIVLETFMVYPNIFHDPPRSLVTALEFMKVRAPSDFYPPLGFLSWVLGTASAIATWRTPHARRWMLASLSMIVCEGLLSMAFFWPRNTIMFIEGPAVHSPEVLQQAALEFARMHWWRVTFNGVAAVTAFRSFLLCYRSSLAASVAAHDHGAAPPSVAGVRGGRAGSRQLRFTVGHLILATMSIAIVAGTALADLSALHAQNANWPPHARFHAMWHVVHVACVQCVGLALLWAAAKGVSVHGVWAAAGLLGSYALSFLASAASTPLFGASITPDVSAALMPRRPLGLDGNLFSVLVVTPMILIGWALARRSDCPAGDEGQARDHI
jgi:hypothetical protein